MSNGERAIFAAYCIGSLILVAVLLFISGNLPAPTTCACPPLTSVPIAVGKVQGYGYVEVYKTDTNARYMFPIANTKITIYEEAVK
jgi:hypothetical protein